MMTKLGTPYYVAPEVLEGIYGKQCDLWAVGVITFVLLTGEPPFNGKTEAEVFHKIKSCDYDFLDKAWTNISDNSKDFIRKLLISDQNQRMTAE